jgi:ech hydrogenase subunit E
MWSELHRIQSHLLWLGLFADSFGFESLFMQFWRVRERIMDISEATTGNRVIVSVNVIGGVRRNPDAEQLRWLLTQLDWVEEEVQRLETTMLEDYTVKKRTVGKGTLTSEKAYELGAVGPVLRASGIAQDTRQTGYAAYGNSFQLVVETGGTALPAARSASGNPGQHRPGPPGHQPASRREVRQDQGKTTPGETVSRVEQPRGELLYIKGKGRRPSTACASAPPPSPTSRRC